MTMQTSVANAPLTPMPVVALGDAEVRAPVPAVSSDEPPMRRSELPTLPGGLFDEEPDTKPMFG